MLALTNWQSGAFASDNQGPLDMNIKASYRHTDNPNIANKSSQILSETVTIRPGWEYSGGHQRMSLAINHTSDMVSESGYQSAVLDLKGDYSGRRIMISHLISAGWYDQRGDMSKSYFDTTSSTGEGITRAVTGSLDGIYALTENHWLQLGAYLKEQRSGIHSQLSTYSLGVGWHGIANTKFITLATAGSYQDSDGIQSDVAIIEQTIDHSLSPTTTLLGGIGGQRISTDDSATLKTIGFAKLIHQDGTINTTTSISRKLDSDSAKGGVFVSNRGEVAAEMNTSGFESWRVGARKQLDERINEESTEPVIFDGYILDASHSRTWVGGLGTGNLDFGQSLAVEQSQRPATWISKTISLFISARW